MTQRKISINLGQHDSAATISTTSGMTGGLQVQIDDSSLTKREDAIVLLTEIANRIQKEPWPPTTGETVSALKLLAQYDPINYYADTQSQYTGYLSSSDDLVGGGAVNELRASFWMRYIPDTNNTGNDVAVGNDLTVECVIQALGVNYHLTWGGQPTKVLTSGVNDIQSDPVSVLTAFGVDSLPVGTRIRKKMRVVVPSGGMIPIQAKLNTYSTGGQAIWYDVTTVTPADINAIGGWTSTGTGTSSRTSAFSFKLLARHVSPNAFAAIAIGDSLTNGLNDTQTGTLYGGFNRANGQLAIPAATMSFAVNGVSAKFGSTSSMVSSIMQYGPSGLYIMAGTNDIPGITAAAAVANIDTRVAQWRAAGGTGKVVVGTLYPRDTSTDSWATTANQTPFSGWAAGGIAEQYNALLTTPKYDYVVASLPLRDATIPQAWAVNGTANYLTKDGTHPSPAGYSLQSAPILAGLQATGWGV